MLYLLEYNADFTSYKYFLKTDYSLHLCIFKFVSHFTRYSQQKAILYSFMFNSGPLSLVTHKTKKHYICLKNSLTHHKFLRPNWYTHILHGSATMGQHQLGQYKEARWTENCNVRSYTVLGASLVSHVLKL